MTEQEIRHKFLQLWDQTVDTKNYNKQPWRDMDIILTQLLAGVNPDDIPEPKEI